MRRIVNSQTLIGVLLVLVAVVPWQSLIGTLGGKTGPIAAAIIYESGDAPKYSVGQIEAMASSQCVEYMRAAGFPWYPRIDKDQDAPAGRELPPAIVAAKGAAQGKPFPCLVVLSKESGKVLAVEQVQNEAATLATLRKFGG